MNSKNNLQQQQPFPGGMPLIPNAAGNSALNNQSTSSLNRFPLVATRTLNSMTVIRPSPGTVTDVIIRPAVFDASAFSAQQQRFSPSLGRTQVLSFPSTGDFSNLQIEHNGMEYYVPRSTQAPYALPASRQRQQFQPQFVNTLVSYPVVTSISHGVSQTNFQPIVGRGQLCPVPPSPYNFQNQRNPLLGISSSGIPQFPPQTLGSSTMLGGQVISTSGSNDQFPPYKKYLQQTLSDIQLLNNGTLSPNAPKVSANMNGFDALLNTCHIFIEPANNSFPEASFPSLNKFNLIDSYGSRLFYALEKRNRNQNKCCGGSCGLPVVNVSVMQGNGQECMALNGDTAMVGFRVPGTDGVLHTLGYVMEDTHVCSMTTTYLLKDKYGSLSFKLNPEKGVNNPTDIDVFGNDDVKIGRLGKCWGNLPDSSTDLSHTYGVSFPKDMNTDEKGLMIGALISIYWKYFVDTKRDQRIARGAWCCVTGCTVFILLVILGFAFLAARVVRHSS